MRYPQSYCAAVLAVALITPFTFAQNQLSVSPVKLSRSTPEVEAVKKTIGGVVAIRVPRQGERDMVGSGVLVDESGVIITNRHVTGGKKQLKIRLNDGTELTGEVTMTEPDLDLAVIEIKTTKKLKILPMGPTDDLMVGETVLAIGSPFGYDATVSRGIISALNREITMPNDVLMTGLIQHDAPINPGNSGGPLVNINGEVIGINVAMRDGAQNIAFTINATMVKGFLKKYSKRRSTVQHGVKVEEKTVAQVGDRQRVVVKNTSHAELKSGDEIRTIGALKVANAFDIERAIWHKKPGQQVEVKVNREGREVTVLLTLEASHGAGSAAVVSAETPAANDAATAASVRTANER
jgi:serine protease Do